MVLCWSAAEAAHYLELYKSCENVSFASIKGQQASSYADRLVEFVTIPRSLNKSDAVALVANFGSLRNAVNADAEALGWMSGWGGVKVKRWAKAVEEPFRARKAAKRGLSRTTSTTEGPGGEETEKLLRLQQARASPSESSAPHEAPLPTDSSIKGTLSSYGETPNQKQQSQRSGQFQFMDDGLDEEDENAILTVVIEESNITATTARASLKQKGDSGTANAPGDDALSGGVAAALAKLRERG